MDALQKNINRRRNDNRALLCACICKQSKGFIFGIFGRSLLQEGKTETAAEHAPEYLRLSQAERELKEKMERTKDAGNNL